MLPDWIWDFTVALELGMTTWLFVRFSLDVASVKFTPAVAIEAGVNGKLEGLIVTTPPEPMFTAPIVRLTVVEPVLPAKLTAPLAVRFALEASAPFTFSVAPALVTTLVLAIAPAAPTVRFPAATVVGPAKVFAPPS